MKQIGTIISLSLFFTACIGQSNTMDHSKKIKEQAEIMGQLLLNGDFNSFSKYTYPRIIEMMGGKQKML